MSTKTQSAADAETLAWLDSHNVQYHQPRVIPLALIDVRASRGNQARAESLDAETVERYAQGFRNGDTFPSFVVYKKGDGFVLVDGNHRDGGARKASVKEHSMIVIAGTTPTEMIELLKAEANTRHGVPTSTTWRLTQAVDLIGLGHDIEQVAKSLGLSERQIRNTQSLLKVNDRASRLRIVGWADVPTTTRQTMARIRLDSVFIEISRLITTTGFGGSEMTKFITDVNRLSSEAEMLAVVSQKQADRLALKKQKDALGKVVRSNPKGRISSALGSVLAIEESILPSAFITDFERETFAKQMDDAAEHLMGLAESLRAEA